MMDPEGVYDGAVANIHALPLFDTVFTPANDAVPSVELDIVHDAAALPFVAIDEFPVIVVAPAARVVTVAADGVIEPRIPSRVPAWAVTVPVMIPFAAAVSMIVFRASWT